MNEYILVCEPFESFIALLVIVDFNNHPQKPRNIDIAKSRHEKASQE